MTEFLNLLPKEPNRREILRYAATKENAEDLALLDVCLDKCQGVLNYSVGFCELKFTIDADDCDFGDFCIRSKTLAENLKGARRVFLFVATVGLGIDRLIAKYSRTSPATALMIGAIGTERVEALADSFVEWLEKKYSLVSRPRFSAGYGDLPLSIQEDIFKLLRPENHLGVFLSDSFIMSPSKSVTAFVGLK